MKIFGILVLAIAAVAAKHEEYAGWRSYYVGPPTQEQLPLLGQISSEFDLDILSHPIVQREGVVLVKPEHQAGLESRLREVGIPFKTHAADVKRSLELDDDLFARRRNESRARNGGRNLPYDNYQTWATIEAYLLDIAARYPEIVTLETPATSFEGRPIRVIKISTTNFQDTSKPVIFVDGGIHAREWISPPTVTWAIHKLTDDLTDPDLLQNFDWILLPVVNPDGYVHTFESSRFWRKTRSTNTHALSPVCPGVDGNRNYDFFWNTVGTSSSPCADTYAGNVPFSEIETRVVRDIIQQYLNRMPLYLTMHSYGSMILFPWGHDGTLSANAFALLTVGVGMAEEMDALSLPNFPPYIVGNSVLVIGYGAAGAAEDYAHAVGVPLAYTYELPGLATGLNGFHLDPIFIQQVAQETWAGIAEGARRAGQLYRTSTLVQDARLAKEKVLVTKPMGIGSDRECYIAGYFASRGIRNDVYS